VIVANHRLPKYAIDLRERQHHVWRLAFLPSFQPITETPVISIPDLATG